MVKIDKTELVLGVLVLIFSMFPTQIFSLAVAQWITLICGLLLIIHSFAEKNFKMYNPNVSKGFTPRAKLNLKKSSRSKKRRR